MRFATLLPDEIFAINSALRAMIEDMSLLLEDGEIADEDIPGFKLALQTAKNAKEKLTHSVDPEQN